MSATTGFTILTILFNLLVFSSHSRWRAGCTFVPTGSCTTSTKGGRTSRVPTKRSCVFSATTYGVRSRRWSSLLSTTSRGSLPSTTSRGSLHPAASWCGLPTTTGRCSLPPAKRRCSLPPAKRRRCICPAATIRRRSSSRRDSSRRRAADCHSARKSRKVKR